MKLLAVDIGNTTINFGLFEDKKLKKKVKILSKLLPKKDIPFGDFGAAVVSSVVPELTSAIVKKIKKFHDDRRVFIVTSRNVPIKLKVDIPDQVGADRIVNAIAAREIYGCPAVVIDLGTATTFDIVSKKGEYSGGVIAPGIQMSIDALYEKTSQLPRVNMKLPQNIIGKNTNDAIISGVIFGKVGMIREVMGRIGSGKWEVGSGRVILTGGYAKMLSKYFPNFVVDCDLTLKGLKIIYDRHDIKLITCY